jgi:hypothetical protein
MANCRLLLVCMTRTCSVNSCGNDFRHEEGAGVDNKDQAAWNEYRKSLEKPEDMFVRWQNNQDCHES